MCPYEVEYLGFRKPFRLKQANLRDARQMATHSPGNAGIVVVDTSDFTWKAYGGYLAEIDGRQP